MNTARSKSDSTVSSHSSHYSSRIASLDGLRTFAVGLVMANHLFQPLTFAGRPLVAWALEGGWTGVDLFFVLSGFLVSGILFENAAARNLFSVFYFRRAMRILAPYYLFLAVAFLSVTKWGDPSTYVPWGMFLTHTQTFYFGYFNTWSYPFLNITWSLGIEEYFYLMLPAAVLLLKPKTLIRAFALAFVALPALRALLQSQNEALHLATTVFRTDGLCAGVLLSYFWRRNPDWFRSRQTTWWALWAVGAGAFVFYFQNIRGVSQVLVTGLVYPLLALFFALTVVLALVTKPQSPLQRLLCFGPIVYVGRISYSMYLFHAFLYWAAVRLTDNYSLLTSVIASALTVVLAAALWELYEKKLVARGHSIGYAQVEQPAGSRYRREHELRRI